MKASLLNDEEKSTIDLQIEHDLKQELIDFTVLKRISSQNIFDQEQCCYYKLQASIKPESVIHCMTFNSQFILYVQNKILTVYCVKEDKVYSQNIRHHLQTKIQSITITSDSKFVYIVTEYYLMRFLLLNYMIKFQNRVQIRRFIQIQQISDQLMFIDNLKDDNTWEKKNLLRLISWNTRKIIFKINHKVDVKNHILDYDFLNFCVVYESRSDWVIKIQNIQNRQVLLQINLADQYKHPLQNLFLLKNTNDLILVYYNYITINVLNYKDRKIERIKQMINNFIQIHYIDTQLALLSEKNYLIFDKNYNVQSKFKVNCKNLSPYSSKSVINFHVNKPSLLIFGDLTHLSILTSQPKKADVTEYFLERMSYYSQLLIGYSETQTKHIISPNDQYIAISHQNQLIIYYLNYKQEILQMYQYYIKVLAFSTDSTILYIKVPDKIVCLNIKSLKVQRIQLKNTKDLICNTQIIILKNHSGEMNTFMKNVRKQIMKTKPILKDQRQIDLIYEKQTIIQANKHEILIKSVSQQKLLIELILKNQYYQLIPNSSMMIVLTKENCLQLWKIDYQKNQLIMIQSLIENLSQIQSYLNNLVLKLNGQFLIIENTGINLQQLESNIKEAVIISKNYIITRDYQRSVNKYNNITVTLRRIYEVFE